jgi:2-polyprenyl-3-methyl-5-hydroxy-6-metoxy-1,4-benzoquinol methylase
MKTLIFTATYNEADNIKSLVFDCLAALPEAEMLVVDDNSPDGTSGILEELATQLDGRLRFICRPRKLGLGSAHKLAMKYALCKGYDALVTMDADYSHHPKYLPAIAKELEVADFVTGSRYAKGGRCDYGAGRQFVSRGANTLTRTLLGIPLFETTTSYRGFRRSLLETMPLHQIRAEGYAFFFESIFHATRTAQKSSEIPIHFEDRRAGTSKISKKEIVRAAFHLLRLFMARITHRLPKRTEAQSGLVDEPCDLCGHLLNTEIYPARNLGHEADTYRCTTAQHGSHGRIVKCLACGLVATNPKLPEAKLNELYAQVSDEEYIANIPSRERTFRYNFDRIRHLLPQNGSLLDVGSYYGVFLNEAREEGFDVHGVEPSHSACEFAHKRYDVDVLCGTLRDRKSQADCDVVTSWDVLEHCYSPSQEIRSVAASLKQGGKFAFCTLNWRNWYARTLGERWPWLIDMHLYYFDDDVIHDMLAKNGLRLIHKSTYCHIITAEYLTKKLVRLRVPLASQISELLSVFPLEKLMVPFRFGDIRMYVAQKA